MKEIPLRNRLGKIVAKAIVDDDVYEKLRENNWSLHRTGYAVRNTTIRTPSLSDKNKMMKRTVTFYMQRVVLGMTPNDKRVADHINENKLDNRKENLRKIPRWMNGYANLPSNSNLPVMLPRPFIADEIDFESLMPGNGTKKQEEYSY